MSRSAFVVALQLGGYPPKFPAHPQEADDEQSNYADNDNGDVEHRLSASLG
ncbi:hypothetical protein [Paenibacillus sp. AR247]|uniref:hypothetical protein n=1 Tax=Paenibacillus sp. AR247 TaxID=1631599 RepID=UPI0021579EA7|nr:hypothetical protein [Paenibacillus sp. AR247]